MNAACGREATSCSYSESRPSSASAWIYRPGKTFGRTRPFLPHNSSVSSEKGIQNGSRDSTLTTIYWFSATLAENEVGSEGAAHEVSGC